MCYISTPVTLTKEKKTHGVTYAAGDIIFEFERLLPVGGDSSSLRYDRITETGKHAGRRIVWGHTENLRVIDLPGTVTGERFTITTETRKLIYKYCAE
jgi:hypothetical protein